MECGFGGTACDVVASIIDLAKSIVPWLDDRWQEILKGEPKADNFFGPLTAATKQMLDPLRPHLEAIFGLLGLSFAIWKWQRHREKVLHKRLLEYLLEEERRLGPSVRSLAEAISRPGRRRNQANKSLLAPKELGRILKRQRWKNSSMLSNIEATTEDALTIANTKIQNQLKLLERTQAGYRDQQAAVHILSGAIKSSFADRQLIGNEERDMHVNALDHFRHALHVEGHAENLLALQYKADQERLLGRDQDALNTYDELEVSASQQDDLGRKF